MAAKKGGGSKLLMDIKAMLNNMQLLRQEFEKLKNEVSSLAKDVVGVKEIAKENKKEIASLSGQKQESIDMKKINLLEERMIVVENKVDSFEKEIKEFRNFLKEIKYNMASKKDLEKIKYKIELINPLEFVTFDQMKEFFEKEMKNKKDEKI